MELIKTNPNPSLKRTGDCVIRSISIAENRSWVDVYDELCEIGKKIHEMPNSKNTYERYLKEKNWVKHKMPKTVEGKRYTVKQLAEEFNNTTFIVAVVHHLATVKIGDLYDTWDCSNKCVYNYFTR